MVRTDQTCVHECASHRLATDRTRDDVGRGTYPCDVNGQRGTVQVDLISPVATDVYRRRDCQRARKKVRCSVGALEQFVTVRYILPSDKQRRSFDYAKDDPPKAFNEFYFDGLIRFSRTSLFLRSGSLNAN
jgi:hypothetical protein